MPLPILATALAFVAVCMLVDIRTRRIPNLLSGSVMLVGTVLNTLYLGYPGLFTSFAGLFLAMAVLIIPFALGGIGAGDVKMMGAVGALLGPRLALSSLGVGMILGGAIMVAHLARLGRLGEKLRSTGGMFSAAVAIGSLEPLRLSADNQTAVALPYSVPLGLGVVAVVTLAARAGVS